MHVFILHRFSVKSGSPEAPRPKLPLFRFVKWLRLRYIALLYLPTFCPVYIYLYATTTPSRTKKTARWPQGRCTKQNDHPSTRSLAQLIK